MADGTHIVSKKMNRLPMLRLQKDIDELFSKRRSLVRSGDHTSTLSAIFYLRPFPDGVDPILFLLHAPKKNIKEAHERNKVKRWMREAMRKNAAANEIAELLTEKKLQALVLIRADFRPSPGHGWQQIEEDIRIIYTRLLKKIQGA
jgi:ribonuclease P protein component